MVPSPPKTRIKSVSRASVAASSPVTGMRPARRMRRVALRRQSAQAALSLLPIRPMRLIWSKDFFNQHEKFFVAGRAEQGRFNHSAPAKTSLRRNKFLKFADDPLVHGVVGDDAAALVGLGLAGLKLRLDEGDNPARVFEQGDGRGQD